MQCTSPIKIYKKDECNNKLSWFEAPCGKCPGCRISHAREWSMRLMHELEFWDDAMFVTLTYNDEHLPVKKINGIFIPVLVKKDLQLFFKRLRKNLGTRKVKYFACGEYGEKKFRCHYHFIVFGLSLSEHAYHIEEQNGRKYNILDGGPIFDCWKKDGFPFGRIQAGTVTPESTRYCAQYIDVKYNNFISWKDFPSEAPFQIVSQGLGLRFCQKHSKRLEKDKFISVNGIKLGLPRYYKKKLNIDVNELIEDSIKRRFEVVEKIVNVNQITNLNEFNEWVRRARKQRLANIVARSNLRDNK